MTNKKQSKKSNTVLGILLVFFLVFVFGVLLFSGITSDSDTNNINYISDSPFRDSFENWPESVPEIVPVFSYGKLDSGSENEVNEGEKIWYILIENLEDGALDNYISDLKDNNWEISVNENIEDGYIAATNDEEKIGLQLSINGKTAILTIQVKP